MDNESERAKDDREANEHHSKTNGPFKPWEMAFERDRERETETETERESHFVVRTFVPLVVPGRVTSNDDERLLSFSLWRIVLVVQRVCTT